jgi:hypothetical protein
VKGAVVGAYQGLDDWVDGISLNLLSLEELEGEDGFRADFTGASLRGLEQALLSHFGEPGDIDDPEGQDLADGAAGYLGEVLLRLAGGTWGWRGGEPFVRADKALDLPPVFPLRLIAQAIGEQTDHEFTDVYASWEQAVGRHRAAKPRWAPKKKRTPGVDPFEMSPTDAAYIAEWETKCRAAFARWTETYGASAVWDFGPDSLDVLESLLARITPTPQDLSSPAHHDFVDGAVWYFGEAIRRIKGGAWVYRTQDLAAPNAYAGDPYVQQAGQDGQLVMPIVILDDFVRSHEPGTLRARHARCAG